MRLADVAGSVGQTWGPTGWVEVTAAREDKPITELRTTVTRGDGTLLLEGTAVCYRMEID